MKLKTAAAICLCLAGAPLLPQTTQTAYGYSQAYEPQGSERRAIMDALRRPVSRRLGQTVIFHVSSLKAKRGWAYLRGAAHKTNDSSFGPDKAWGVVEALLHKEGSRWKVMVWGQATDVSMDEKAQRDYPDAPHSIFESND